MDSGSDASDDEFSPQRFRIVRHGSDASDDEFSPQWFRLVRHCPSPSKRRPGTDQEGAAAVDVPTMMAALSPDPPSSPMSVDDAQSQPRAGTDQEGADAAVDDAPVAMEMERSSPDPPPPMSESGARRSQLTIWRPTLPLRPPCTVESIFDNHRRRGGALIRALTKDEEVLFQKCDPGMQPLHLYGGTDGSWEVKPPELELPAPEPEPTRGINTWRDKMERHKWLQQVAAHCDAWLIKISCFSASFLTAAERGRLFAMIIDLPTVQEILLTSSDTYRCMYYVEEKRSSGPEANAVVEEEKEEVYYAEEKTSSGPDEATEGVEEEQEIYPIEEQGSSGPSEASEVLEEVEEDATDDDNNFCASCNCRYNANAFWIRCDSCERWYHGKCVNITSSQAEHIGHFECLDCYCERVGHDHD